MTYHLLVKQYDTKDGYQVIVEEALGCSAEGSDLVAVLRQVAEQLEKIQ